MFTIKLTASRLVRRSLIVTALTGLLGGATAQAEFKPGDIVPAFSLEAADGLPFSLTQREGNVFLTHGTKSLRPKVLVIHLFQPDCLQCRAQMRALQALYEDFGKSGVAVIGVAHHGDHTTSASSGARDRD
jgi:peroxiredoxin